MHNTSPLPASALSTPQLWRKRLLVAGITLGALVSLPMLGAGHGSPLDLGRWLHLGEHFDLHMGLGRGASTRIRSSNPAGSLDIHLAGRAVFNEAQTEVLKLSGGRLVIDERRAAWQRRAVFEPGQGDQAPSLRYSVDGVARTLDDEGRAWLRDCIALTAESLEGSDKRVKRLLAEGGPARVLADIEDPAQLNDEHRRRSRAEALLRLGQQDEATLHALLKISEGLDSNFERRSLLQALIEQQALSPALQTQLLHSLGSLDSDFERRVVLDALAATLSSDNSTLQAWVQAIAGIDSDFDQRSAIVKLLDRSSTVGLSQVAAALQASHSLHSDFEHRSALEAVARQLPKQLALDDEGERAIQAYVASTREIDSDFERRSALIALLHAGVHQKPALLAVLEAAEDMDSDFERTEVLTAVAAKLPADAELVARYRQAARGLSEHARGQVEAALDPLSERMRRAPASL